MAEDNIPMLEWKLNTVFEANSLLNRVSQTEPSKYEDGSSAVYTLSVQSPFIHRKGLEIGLCADLKYLGLWFDRKLLSRIMASKQQPKLRELLGT